jgi:hypothetical protein
VLVQTRKISKITSSYGAYLKRQRKFSRSHLEDLGGAALHEVFMASDHQWDRKKDKQKPPRKLAKTRPQQHQANQQERIYL